jgi:hypothetical protein
MNWAPIAIVHRRDLMDPDVVGWSVWVGLRLVAGEHGTINPWAFRWAYLSR